MTISTRFAALLVALGVAAPGAPGQEVTLPLEAYESLRHRANPPPTPEPQPPVPFALESADLELRVREDSALLSQRLVLSIHGPGWQEVQLSTSGGFTAADLGDLEGRIVADGPRAALMARGRGRHEIRLESVVALRADEEAARPTRILRVELPKAAVVTGAVWAEGEEVEELALVGGGLVRRQGEGPRWDFVGVPGAVLEARLLEARRVPARALLPLRFHAQAATLARLGRTRLDVEAVIHAGVQQGRLERLRATVPEGLEVVQVQAGEAGWDVEEGVLVITPVAPVEGDLAVRVTLTGRSTESLAIPLLVPVDSSQAELIAGLRVEADGVAVVQDVGSGRAADESELSALPAPFRERGALAFLVRDPKELPTVSVEWPEGGQAEVLAGQVDRLLVEVLVGDAGRAAYQCWATLRSRGSLNLTLRLPRGFVLSSAHRDGVPVVPGDATEGWDLPLGGGDEAQTVHVAGLMDLRLPEGKGRFEIPLPSLSMPAARAEVRAVLPSDREYAFEAADLDSHAGSPESLGAAEGFSAPAGYSVVEASWSALSSSPSPLRLKVKPRSQKKRWF